MKNIITKLFYFAFTLLSAINISSAQNPVSAPAQSEPIPIEGAALHAGNGQIIDNAVVVFIKVKIIYAGDEKRKSRIARKMTEAKNKGEKT